MLYDRKLRNAIEKPTYDILDIRKKTVEHISLVDSENVIQFESMITGHIIRLMSLFILIFSLLLIIRGLNLGIKYINPEINSAKSRT